MDLCSGLSRLVAANSSFELTSCVKRNRFSTVVLCCSRFGLVEEFPGSREQGVTALDCFDGALDHGLPQHRQLFLIHWEPAFAAGLLLTGS